MDEAVLQRTLQRMEGEVSKISEAVVELARQDQKILHIIERQNRMEEELVEVQRELRGPDGLQVRVAKNTLRLALICTGSSIVAGSVTSVIMRALFL